MTNDIGALMARLRARREMWENPAPDCIATHIISSSALNREVVTIVVALHRGGYQAAEELPDEFFYDLATNALLQPIRDTVDRLDIDCQIEGWVRIPTKPPTYSDMKSPRCSKVKPPRDSDLKPPTCEAIPSGQRG